MGVAQEFSKHSEHYGEYNVIQKKVRDEVLQHLSAEPKVIADLGCGEGALFRAIDWEYERFIAVDFAEGMLQEHPESKKIEKILADFNKDNIFHTLHSQNIEYLFSLSALQWADDLAHVFQNIASLECDFSLAIFTANTFKTLHETAGLKPLLRSREAVQDLAQQYLQAESYVKEYHLEFENSREMLRYIKKSGVSGARKVLSLKETKALMQNYPLNYLEFEVIFINGVDQARP